MRTIFVCLAACFAVSVARTQEFFWTNPPELPPPPIYWPLPSPTSGVFGFLTLEGAALGIRITGTLNNAGTAEFGTLDADGGFQRVRLIEGDMSFFAYAPEPEQFEGVWGWTLEATWLMDAEQQELLRAGGLYLRAVVSVNEEVQTFTKQIVGIAMIPEPAAAWAVGLIMVGVVFWRRRATVVSDQQGAER